MGSMSSMVAGRNGARMTKVTIAYLAKTNNFDVKLQVIYAEPGSQWTRVGLMARNDLNVGESPDDRNSATGDASAYAETHINPNQTLGSSGRFDPLGITPGSPDSEQQSRNRISAWPRVRRVRVGRALMQASRLSRMFWLRLARVGTNLNGYASSDGVAWTLQGTTSLNDQQPHMFVGPFLAVETGNIWNDAGRDVYASPFDPIYDRLFVAQFRNFGNTFPPSLSIGPIRREHSSLPSPVHCSLHHHCSAHGLWWPPRARMLLPPQAAPDSSGHRISDSLFNHRRPDGFRPVFCFVDLPFLSAKHGCQFLLNGPWWLSCVTAKLI